MKNNSILNFFIKTVFSPRKKQSEKINLVNPIEENIYSGVNLRIVNSYRGYENWDYREIKKLSWYGKGNTIEIQGYKIIDPLVYISDTGKKSPACHIIPKKLKASSKGNYDHIGYWPSYSELNASQRGMFLKWLSEGKNNTAI